LDGTSRPIQGRHLTICKANPDPQYLVDLLLKTIPPLNRKPRQDAHPQEGFDWWVAPIEKVGGTDWRILKSIIEENLGMRCAKSVDRTNGSLAPRLVGFPSQLVGGTD
jgi:hypothetical protein